MEKIIYEIIKDEFQERILATIEDGTVWVIPIDLSNSDYAAYLESLNDNTETK